MSDKIFLSFICCSLLFGNIADICTNLATGKTFLSIIDRTFLIRLSPHLPRWKQTLVNVSVI